MANFFHPDSSERHGPTGRFHPSGDLTHPPGPSGGAGGPWVDEIADPWVDESAAAWTES